MRLVDDHTALVFPALLQSHAVSKTTLVQSRDVDEFDLFLKSAALVSRGIVVSDSDLNNNRVFHAALQARSETLTEALRSGFVRRAAREVDGGPIAQAVVADGFRRTNPDRAAEIPPDYPEFLDDVFGVAEREHPPLLWLPGELGDIFRQRLKQLLLMELNACSWSVQRSLLERTRDYVLGHERSGTPVLAGQLETDLLPHVIGREAESAWKPIWTTVLEAYNGNVPTAFQGAIVQANNGVVAARYVPAGPESVGADLETEIQAYDASAGRQAHRVEVSASGSGVSRREFAFDHARLEALSLSSVMRLRDECDPDALFTTRFESLGSSEHLDATWTTLTEAALAYAERLHTAGGVLTERVLRAEVEAFAAMDDTRRISVDVYTDDEVVSALCAMVSSLPLQGSEVVACDAHLLKTYLPDIHLSDEDDALAWAFTRPDFRILQEISQRDRGATHPLRP